jgi:hypothetical protein
VTGLPPVDLPDSARELIRKAQQREIEPSPFAKTRVWQRIQAKRTKKPRVGWRLGATFLAGAACASLVALFMLRALGEPPALVVAPDGTARPLRVSESLPRFADLSVADLHAAARVVVGAGSQGKLERLDRQGATLRLERGSLLLHVLPRPVNAPFLVHTPGFTARVVGTVLRVAVDEHGRASLAVGHGAVELQPAGSQKSVLVRAGERWPADSTAAPSRLELEKLGAEDLEGTTADAFAPPVPKPVSPALSEESSLYQAGLEALRDRDPHGALALFRLEQSKFPRGTLRREVRTSILDALLALGDQAPALREIDTALADEPHGLRAPELHWLKGSILRKLDGNCRRARAELDRALQHPPGDAPWAASARRLRASCSAR